VYTFPNIILPFIGGFLLDTVIGSRWGTIIFGFFVVLGTVLEVVGPYTNWHPYWWFLVARFFYGFESL
jgi:MFS family permease